jgi:hypothetical protein
MTMKVQGVYMYVDTYCTVQHTVHPSSWRFGKSVSW